MNVRRGVEVAVLIAVLAGSMAGACLAQEKFPNWPSDFIVTWGTGGGADAMARTIGGLAHPILRAALPVSNVPGASGNTGMAQLLNSKPDGYTVATYIQDTLMTIPMGGARYTVGDLEWIVRTQVADSFFFVRTESPFKTIQDLLAHVKENPGKVRVAATGFGTLDDVRVRFFEKKGYKMITVPYPKPGERYAAALGGHAEVLVTVQADPMKPAPRATKRLIVLELLSPLSH